MQDARNDSRARLEALLASQPLAVVATAHEGAPYASLVAIAAQGDARLFFATTRATRKWRNLEADPRIAILLDDRTREPADFHAAAAATGIGRATECAGEEAEAARAALLARHPHLADFLASPSTALVRVDIERWYVVTRFQAVDCIVTGGEDPHDGASKARPSESGP